MKKAYGISILCTLLFLFITGNALADEEFGPGVFDDECDTVLDVANCCDRAADETSRIQARCLVDRALHQRNADERLGAGQQDPARFAAVAIDEFVVIKHAPVSRRSAGKGCLSSRL